MTKIEMFQQLVDYRINSITRICDMIKIDFSSNEKELCLHIQSALFRVVKQDKLLISSNDIYVPSVNYIAKRFKKFKWDVPGNTLFDDCLQKIISKMLGKKVVSVNYDGQDLIINLEGQERIEIISNTLEKECEKFRLFVKGDIDSHIVVET